MSVEKIEIGAVPHNESCEQVGTPLYDAANARKQAHTYLKQLRWYFGAEPIGAKLMVTSNPHDFGNYYEVACMYDDENDMAELYALSVSEGLSNWFDDKTVAQYPSSGFGAFYRALDIVSGENATVGIFSLRDALRTLEMLPDCPQQAVA